MTSERELSIERRITRLEILVLLNFLATLGTGALPWLSLIK